MDLDCWFRQLSDGEQSTNSVDSVEYFLSRGDVQHSGSGNTGAKAVEIEGVSVA